MSPLPRLLAQGGTVAEQTYHRWRNQCGGMKADDASELRKLREENQRMKRTVADKAVEINGASEMRRFGNEQGADAAAAVAGGSTIG